MNREFLFPLASHKAGASVIGAFPSRGQTEAWRVQVHPGWRPPALESHMVITALGAPHPRALSPGGRAAGVHVPGA